MLVVSYGKMLAFDLNSKHFEDSKILVYVNLNKKKINVGY